MFVKQRMTARPFTVSPEQSVPEAVEIMTDRNVRQLPVVEDGRVVGIISHGDLAAASPSKATSLSAGELTYLLAKLKVAKVMTKNPITIGPDALLEEAAVLMRDNKIEMLPVVDRGSLVGVITESDILDSFIEILGFRDPGTRLTIEAMDEPGVLSRLTGITAQFHANITHLAVYRGQFDKSVVVLGVNSHNTADMEQAITANGFEILARLEN